MALRLALVVECAFGVFASLREIEYIQRLCAYICAEKQITVWDVARDNSGAIALDVGFVILTVCAIIFARRSPLVALLLAAIPIAGFVATLVMVVLSNQASWDTIQFVFAVYFVPATAGAVVFAASLRRALFGGRNDRSEAPAT